MVSVTVVLTSNEVQRVEKTSSALWPDEINNGRLSRLEIIRRFTCAGTELFPRLSNRKQRALEKKFLAAANSPNRLHFKGRLPRG